MVKEMTPEERIEVMKNNLQSKFEDEAKTILKDGKVLKAEEAKKNFNTELNELTFEIDKLYPLDYEEFKANFPKTIELVQKVNGNNVVDAVNKGLVIQGWAVKSNVETIIENIKNNVQDKEKAKEEISLRNSVYNEIQTMKEKFDIEWCQDLFWKTWKIKEGEKRMEQLIEFRGEDLAQKRIDNLKQIGGLNFLSILQKEVYQEE